MAAPPSKEQPPFNPLVRPSTTIRALCQGNLNEEIVIEHRLVGKPEDLKSFLDLFHDPKRHGGELWSSESFLFVTAAAYVRLGRFPNIPDVLPAEYQRRHFMLGFENELGYGFYLNIYSPSFEEAARCLELVVGLRDNRFVKLEMFRVSAYQFPLTPHNLEQMFRNSPNRRVYAFHDISFSAAQCHTLATCGTKTSLQFCNSDFGHDGGTSFLESFAARTERSTGPKGLAFDSQLFDREVLIQLFDLLIRNADCLDSL
jgi:hypothetical protein